MHQSLAKNSMYNVIYQFLNILFPFITSIYIARIFGKSIVGEITYTQNYIVYFVAVVTSGIPTYGIREIARIKESKKEKNKLFTELFSLNAIFTTLALIAYSVFLALGKNIISNYRLAFIFSLLIIWNYINVDWFYMGIEEYKYIALRSTAVKIISFISLLIFVQDKSDMYIYAFLLCLGTGLNSVFNILHINKYIKIDFSEIVLVKHLSVILLLAINVFLDSLYSKSDITMLGIISDQSEVGIYIYAYRLPDVIMTTCVSVTAVFFPRLVKYYKENSKKFLLLVNDGIKIILFITIPATFGYIAVAPEVFSLFFGEEFINAVPATRVLAFMIIIKCLGNLLAYQVVFCTGDEKKRLPIYLGAALMNIILNFLFIPMFGAFGAAIASVITELALNMSIIIYEYKYVKFSWDKLNTLKTFLASIVMFIIVLLIKTINVCNIAKILLCVFCGIVVYIFVSIILKNEIINSIKDIIFYKYSGKE